MVAVRFGAEPEWGGWARLAGGSHHRWRFRRRGWLRELETDEANPLEVLWEEWGELPTARRHGWGRRRGARAVAAWVRAEGRWRGAGAVGDGAVELREWVIALRRPVGEEFGSGEAHGSAERNGSAC